MCPRLGCLVVLLALALPTRGQTTFDWPTSVVHSYHPASSELASAAGSAPSADLEALTEEILAGRFAAGTAVMVQHAGRSQTALASLIEAAEGAGVHVVLALPNPASDSVAQEAVRAASLGADAFVVSSEGVSTLRASLPAGVRIAAAEEAAPGADAVLVDPPLDAMSSNPDWDALFASMVRAPTPVTHVRPATLPEEAVYPLLLAPGGIHVVHDSFEGDALFQTIAAFRARHPAVGAGLHEPLPNNTYAFVRSLSAGRRDDTVVVVFGAKGRTTVNVSRAFPDDTMLLDAVTGSTAFVSFGMAGFDAHPSGIILIEEQP